MPDYLSAADFASGLHRSKPYVSPIKIGEYWASGLPVFLTHGVGDDSEIVATEGDGAVFDLSRPESIPSALALLRATLSQPDYRT